MVDLKLIQDYFSAVNFIIITEGLMFKLLVYILFFVLFSIVPYSQTNLTDLQKQLPKTVKENPELLKQITLTLQRDISLNPELVAYRINYYKKLFDEGVKDNDKNGFNNLRLQTLEYYQKRNKWLDNEKEIIQNSPYSSSYKIKTSEIIDDLHSAIIDTNVKAIYDLDRNYIDYFSAIALGTQNLGDYNLTTNYTKSKNGIEKVIRDDQIEKLNYIGNDVELIGPIETILNYWYLFPNDDLKEDFVLSDLLLKYVESFYRFDNLSKNEIFFGINFFQIQEILNINSSGSTIPEGAFLGEMKTRNQISLIVNHKFIFSDYYRLFSFVTFGIGASISVNPQTSINEKFINYYRVPQSDGGFISETWNMNNFIESSSFRSSIFVKGSTPILFLNKYNFIEIGFITGLNYCSLNLNYDYTYDKVQVLWDDNLQRYVSTLLDRKLGLQDFEEISSTKFFIYPTVDISFYSFSPILLQFSVGYNFISAKVGYGF